MAGVAVSQKATATATQQHQYHNNISNNYKNNNNNKAQSTKHTYTKDTKHTQSTHKVLKARTYAGCCCEFHRAYHQRLHRAGCAPHSAISHSCSKPHSDQLPEPRPLRHRPPSFLLPPTLGDVLCLRRAPWESVFVEYSSTHGLGRPCGGPLRHRAG